MVKAIIFDVWGTLVETGVKPSPSKQVKYFLRARERFGDFIVKFEKSFMTQEYESLQEAFEQVVKEMDLRIPDFVYEKLVGMWNKNAILAKPYDDSEEVLKELKDKGYKLFIIANIDKFSYEQLKQKMDFSIFDGVYLSYESGLLKNDKESYEAILKDNKLKKDDVLMVGDSIVSDIKSAENAGITGLLIDRRETRDYENKVKSLRELADSL